MRRAIESVIDDFESGRISRRQLIAQLTMLTTGLAGSRSSVAQDVPSFKATGLNHIALRVTHVPRSRDFYVKHLGLAVTRDSPDNCFMTFGDSFVALFKGDAGAMDHFCFSVENYNVLEAEKKLRALGLNPDQPKGTDRIYFNDPDGIKVQLSAANQKP